MDSRTRTTQAIELFGIAAIGLLGVFLVVIPDITYGRLPGNTGDARLNTFILEHFYQWITGKVPDLWDAGFFYPYPLTLAFSDNHLGNAFIFAALRVLGFDREDAFRGWFLAGFIINFAACHYALKRLGYGYFAAAIGAFLFSFGLPVTAQEGHAQLIYRFGVPLAALALIEFSARPRLGALFALLFWTIWQFYCSIYIGYFLGLLLAALALALPFKQSGFSFAVIACWPRWLGQAWRDASPTARMLWLAGTLAAIGLLGALLAPYVEVGKLYGFRREPTEIESMLPRLASYLYSTNSELWHFSWPAFRKLPMAHEHPMFVGLAPFLAILVAILLRWPRNAAPDRHLVPAIASILLVGALTLYDRHHSLYAFIENTPGLNAIRAVTRVITVLLFPFSVILASAVDAAMRMRPPGLAARGIAVALAALTVFESAYVVHFVSGKQEWLDRLTAFEARLPKDMPANAVLMVAPTPDSYFDVDLDAMLVAQQHGWRTFNGYSASEPNGYAYTGSCDDAAANIANGLNLLKRNSDQDYQEIARRTVRIGYDDCDTQSLTRRPTITAFAGPLPAEAMASLTVKVEGIRPIAGLLHVALSLSNGGKSTIPALSTTGTPVRMSAKYLGPNESRDDPDFKTKRWDLRQNLVSDIAPGETKRLDLLVPPPVKPGIPFRIAVSLVQDGVVWFHDRGMTIAIGSQTVTRDGEGVKIGE